jgi:uncharacterized protein YggE
VNRRCNRNLFVFTLMASGCLTSAPSRGQTAPTVAAPEAGFTVKGKGLAKAAPNALEIELQVAASSELTADAIVKYRDARKRLEAAFSALKLENVRVIEQGLLVDQKSAVASPYYYDSPPARGKSEVQLSRRLIVRCDRIGGMDEEAVMQLVARLLDVAQDAGGQVGPSTSQNSNVYYYDGYPRSNPPLVQFVLDDFQPLEQKAYEQALSDARIRASRLATISGVTLGPVVSARETVVPGESPSSAVTDDLSYLIARAIRPADESPAPARRLVSPRFQEISIPVELVVRFAVGPEAAAPSGAGR